MESQPTLTDEEKRQLKLIAELPRNEAFTIWRDKFCRPVVKQLRDKLKDPRQLSDVELRAAVMHFNTTESLMETIFDEARFLTEE